MENRGQLGFDESGYINLVLSNIPAAQTCEEVSRIKMALDLGRGSRILDVGCGSGRHALELDSEFEVVGIDSSERLLNLTRLYSRERGIRAHFIPASMDFMPLRRESFEGAYNLFSSFGFFDRERDQRVLGQVWYVLKYGSRFYLETLVKDKVKNFEHTHEWIKPYFGETRERSRRGIKYKDNWRVEDGLLEVKREAFDLGKAFDSTTLKLYIYSLEEILKLFKYSGFKILKEDLIRPSESVPLERLCILGEKE